MFQHPAHEIVLESGRRDSLCSSHSAHLHSLDERVEGATFEDAIERGSLERLPPF